MQATASSKRSGSIQGEKAADGDCEACRERFQMLYELRGEISAYPVEGQHYVEKLPGRTRLDL